MTTDEITKPPKWFWVIATSILLWNLMGVFNYLNQTFNQVAMLAALNQDQRAVFEAIPTWATGVFAFAVFSGLLASVGLLLRKKWADPVFILSLVAATIQFAHWLFVSDAVAAFGPTSYIMPILVLIIGTYEIFFAKKGITKGWLT